MEVLHFADVHYDEKNFVEIQKCMDFIIATAEERCPDVIICSGDVTNSEYLGASTKSARAIMESFRMLSDIAPVAVVIGTPSHDGQTPELLKYVSGKHPIWVTEKPEQLLLLESDGIFYWSTVGGYKLQPPEDEIKCIISQVPAPTKEHWKNRDGVETDNENISQAMGSIFSSFAVAAKQFPEVPHILNGHFSMKGSKITETQLLPGSDIAIGSDVLAMAGADLYCLGHIHMRQSYIIAGVENCFHAGSTWRKNYGERNEAKGFYIHTVGKSTKYSTYLPESGDYSVFIETPTRHMIQWEYNLVESPEQLDCDDFEAFVVGQFGEELRFNPFVKIKITIYMDDIRLINQSRLKQMLVDAGASDVTLEIDRVRRENTRDEAVIKAEGLVDKIKCLEKFRSEPAPEGVYEILENVERLNESDLVNYAIKRIGE